MQDVEVLREVQRMRAEGLQTPAINEHLASVVFAPLAQDLQSAQEGQQQAIAPALVIEYLVKLEERLQRIETRTDERIEAVERRVRPSETQRQRVDVMFLVLIAFALGLIIGSAWAWFQ